MPRLMKVSRALTLAVLASGAVCVLAANAPAAEAAAGPQLPLLEQELARLAAAARATVGVAAIHLETGRSAYLNGSVAFPMASTRKVPLAVHILKRVDQGRLKLDDTVTLEARDIYPKQWGPIAKYFTPGSALTIRDLLTLTLVVSDDNATDVLLRVGGGARAVMTSMQAVGLDSLRMERPAWAVVANFYGRPEVSEDNPISPEEFGRLLATTTQAETDSGRHGDDPYNTVTPQDMATLLSRLWNQELLSPASTQLLLDNMYGCETGAARLKGMLPPGTPVAHKTGTIGASTNDVGIIDLPDGAGHVVAVVFTTESQQPQLASREAAIAQIARAIHDYFLFARGAEAMNSE